MGGLQDEIDHTWPTENCCRVYEYKLFRGRFMDFCHWETTDISHRRSITELAFGWDNWNEEVSSFKCGREVGVKLYSSTTDFNDDRNLLDHAGPFSANP